MEAEVEIRKLKFISSVINRNQYRLIICSGAGMYELTIGDEFINQIKDEIKKIEKK